MHNANKGLDIQELARTNRKVRRGMRQAAVLALMVTAILLLGGCNAEKKHASPMPPLTPTQAYTEPEQRYANPGSLFSASGASQLYEDNRARRVGDLVMIKIVENTKAKEKVDTTATRSSDINLGVSAAFGRSTVSPLYYSMGNILRGNVGTDPILGATSTSNLSGTGETKRENYVTTSIGARVIQVLPGGLLQVEGAREIRVNEETEYMVITGLVRPSDILADNSVLSTQLADSTVSYHGKGVLTEKQKPGWFIRLMDNIWPF